MRPVFLIGIFILASIVQNSPSSGQPMPHFNNYFDQIRDEGSDFFDKTGDVIQGRRKLNVQVSSEGVSVSVGPSPAEIGAIVAIGIGVILIIICCCCCIKSCCCSRRPEPTTVVYQQMGPTPTATGRTMTMHPPHQSQNGYGGPIETVNFDPMPTVKEISSPPYAYPPGTKLPV